MSWSLDYLTDFFDMNGSDQEHKVRLAKDDFLFNCIDLLTDALDVPYHSARAIAFAVLGRMSDHKLHYHTPVHVLSIFQFAEKISEEGAGELYELTPMMALAIWFHDSVYVPCTDEGQNEYNSTLFMNAMMQPFLRHKDGLGEAGAFIGTTAYHLDPESKEGYEHSHSLIMDLDLCNFAWDYEHFAKASSLVALEYKDLFSPEDSRKKRKSFLEKMLGKGFVYRTPYFKKNYEEKAVANLKRAIEEM